MARINSTVEHDEIREWAERLGGRPARAKNARSVEQRLRIALPGGNEGEELEPISWDEWFRDFDANHLAFIYALEPDPGERFPHYKLVGRDSLQARMW